MSMIRERLDRIYTPLEEAVALLHTRRRNITADSDGELERRLAARSCAVLFRQVATPNFELRHFRSLAADAGLWPVVLEFPGDKFAHCNPEKYAIARLTFSLGTGRNGGSRNRCVAVVDMTKANGRLMSEVKTFWNQPLIEFHHELLTDSGLGLDLERYDSTAWFQSHGGSARLYYADFFELFVDRAILFESFLQTPGETIFTEETILPAFESVCAQRGQRPLICRLDPPEREGDPYWHHYPPELLPVVLARKIQLIE
jgi:hypothetical protein